jgi:hypothetical protein
MTTAGAATRAIPMRNIVLLAAPWIAPDPGRPVIRVFLGMGMGPWLQPK